MSIDNLTILGKSIPLGGSAQLSLGTARLHTRNPIEVPVIIERGAKPGPCILLTAGIHGNEINGVEIVRQIVSKGLNKPDCGTVICIPVVNVFGFLNQTREFPDGRDLNRVFPGSQKGALANQFAYQLIQEIIPHVDYCIDYHTGGASRFNYSQIRVTGQNEDALNLAKIFGAKFILFAQNRDKSFRQTATQNGVKVLLFEGGKSLDLDRHVTKAGVEGAVRVMHHLGLRKFDYKMLETADDPIIIEKSQWIRAKHSGMYRSQVRNGSRVSIGDVIGSISDPFGDFEKVVKASHSGYVICSNHAPIVNQGDAILHVSIDI